MKNLKGKFYSKNKSFFQVILAVLLFSFSFTSCKIENKEKTENSDQRKLKTLLNNEIKYFEAQKDKIKIIQRVTINGKTEEKAQNTDELKRALETLTEMEIDLILENTSYIKKEQKLINARKSEVFEENYILKPEERSPVKRFSIYYTKNNSSADKSNIAGLFILKKSDNKLFSSRQTHYLKFNDQKHLSYIEMNGIQKIIFADTIYFKSAIRISN